MADPQIYINEAKRLENSKSIFEFLIKDMSSDRYEKIAEQYKKAANIYKITDKEKSIKCFKKVLYYYRQSSNEFNDYNIKEILLNIAELYTKIDYTKSIEYYEQLINYYMEKGDVGNIVKYYELIGDLYFLNSNIEEAKGIYKKTLQISSSNEKSTNIKKRICERLGEILIKYNNQSSYLEASKIYFELADEYLNERLLAYSAKKYILLGILTDCAGDDIVKAKNDFEKYSNIDYSLANSNEGKFTIKLFEAIDSNDSEQISWICAEREKISPLDNVQVSLLLKIKNNINIFQIQNDGEFDNGFDNGFENEQEIDLC